MQKMKKILLANQSAGYLMIDIVNAYAHSGKYGKVELFTGQINIRPSVPDPSVKIIKTVKYNKTTTIKRLVTWLGAFFHLLFVVWSKSKDYELLLVSNPPLTVFVPLFTRKKYSYVVYDLYPDSLFSQGFLKKDSALGRWWKNKNHKVFSNAECVFTLSEDMCRAVEQYVDRAKIKIVYNWVHNEHIKPVAKEDNIFLKEHHLQDKFIVLYSGNMGMTHDVDKLVDAANILKDIDNVHFLFIGEGAKKTIIEKKIADYKIPNCTVLPFQPLEILPYSMGAADVAVVTTDTGQSGLSVPSKTYTYMSAGAALLCLADDNTELSRLTEENNIGRCFHGDEVGKIAQFIKSLADSNDLLATYKTNSRKASLQYSPENAKQYVL